MTIAGETCCAASDPFSGVQGRPREQGGGQRRWCLIQREAHLCPVTPWMMLKGGKSKRWGVQAVPPGYYLGFPGGANAPFTESNLWGFSQDREGDTQRLREEPGLGDHVVDHARLSGSGG